jgi:hypothetical protein
MKETREIGHRFFSSIPGGEYQTLDSDAPRQISAAFRPVGVRSVRFYPRDETTGAAGSHYGLKRNTEDVLATNGA